MCVPRAVRNTCWRLYRSLSLPATEKSALARWTEAILCYHRIWFMVIMFLSFLLLAHMMGTSALNAYLSLVGPVCQILEEFQGAAWKSM